jgi:hypothetical protein
VKLPESTAQPAPMSAYGNGIAYSNLFFIGSYDTPNKRQSGLITYGSVATSLGLYQLLTAQTVSRACRSNRKCGWTVFFSVYKINEMSKL